ncbi:T-lymphocyte activation antigen CD80 [Acomys russatus]|uniref:T-lymphocyte activation antigen CD80 n=1 Tax=Acomys russatus TaxID=60746 RepID=UPI0021E31D31|nr:T-lymphocyte activation antigen CD80 [Acomys russatus]
MGCQLMQDTPLLRLACLFVLLFGLFQLSSEDVGQVSKSVKEKVSLPCGYNFSVEELAILRIYWQKDNEMVLSVISGEREVWPKYKNRTLCDITNNFSLTILGLLPSDRGIYECVVQKNEGTYVLKHCNSRELSIRADFPDPNITQFGNPSADIKTIMCETSGGFPEPRLSWLENGRELSGINTTVFQDPDSELYTISSKLEFNTTKNHSIMCRVVYGNSQVSKNFTWEKPPEAPPDRRIMPVVISIPVLLLITTIIVPVTVYLRKNRRSKRRNVASAEEIKIYTRPIEATV